MSAYAKFEEFQRVRLKRNRPSVSDQPFTQLDIPRAVTTNDEGIIVDVHDVHDVHDVESPGYEVEFFDSDRNTVDVLALAEDEIEPCS